MKWIGILALSDAIYASSAFAQSHIRCQSNIGGPCGDASRPREMNCCDYGYCQPWNSGYYQCLEKPDKCPTQETDIDYFGNDIKTVNGLQPNQCCDECAKTANCKAYTFVNENPDGKTACYLKSSVDGRKEKKGAVSGALVTMPPPENCPVQEYGIDYYGNDIKTVFSLSQGDCCNECGKTANCAVYTYVERGADGRSECYLKTSALGRRDKNGVVSGKLKNPPLPAKCLKQETDVDYYGNDIKTLQGVTVSQCCDACSATSGCTAYTFVEQDGDGKTACYLKSSSGGRTPKTGAVSGELACLTTLTGQCGSRATGPLCCPEGAFCQPWNPGYYQCISKPENAKCPTVVSGVDFYGGDLEVRYGLLPDSCCEACFNNKDCHVFTFINYNPDGKSACYLKSRLLEQRANPAAVSGYKIKQ